MSVITIKSRFSDYSVDFGSIDTYLPQLQKKNPNRLFIVDENVWTLYRRTLLSSLRNEEVMVLPINEKKKSLGTVTKIYDDLIARAAKKNLTLISLGGGILQDITGFAASTIYRGIRWVFIPTTLLAQADSCVGAKTSLNYKDYKNLIGTFYPPAEVFIDIRFLITQKDSDFFSGIGEIVKLHLMSRKAGIENIKNSLPKIISKDLVALERSVRDSIRIKKDYIEEDEFDHGRRNLLNFGHCFGHALETSSGFAIPHGQAVTAGMMLANIVSKSRGELSEKREKELREKILMPTLRVKISASALNDKPVLSAMKKDKKRVGQNLAVILMNDDLSFKKVNDVTTEEAANALDEFRNIRKMIS